MMLSVHFSIECLKKKSKKKVSKVEEAFPLHTRVCQASEALFSLCPAHSPRGGGGWRGVRTRVFKSQVYCYHYCLIKTSLHTCMCKKVVLVIKRFNVHAKMMFCY